MSGSTNNTDNAISWFPEESEGRKPGGQIVSPPTASTGGGLTGTALELYQASGNIEFDAGTNGGGQGGGFAGVASDGLPSQNGGDAYIVGGTADDGGGQSGAQILARGGAIGNLTSYAHVEILADDILFNSLSLVTGYRDFEEIATPAVPASGFLRVYAEAGGIWTIDYLSQRYGPFVEKSYVDALQARLVASGILPS